MSPQADYVVSNGTGAAVRSDINGQLAAIVSNNSGASAPATTYAYQFWADTSTNLLKLRNGANSAFITVGDLTAANLGLATLASPTFTGTATIPTLTVSTAANIPLGSAASPTLYFTGDSNTGLYSPGADQVALSTGGTGRLFIDSSGRCGIGTSSPISLLEVKSAASADCKQTVSVTTATQSAFTSFVNTTVSTVGTENSAGGNLVAGSSGYATILSNNGAYPIQFGTNNTVRATLDSSGRLGIGVTSPSYLLDLGDGSSNAGFANYLRVNTAGDYNFSLQRQSNASFSIRNDGTGAVYLNTQNSIPLVFGVSSGTSSGSITSHARLDSSGRWLLGTSTSTNNARLDQKLAVVAAGTATYAGIGLTTYPGSGDSNASFIDFNRSAGSSDGSMTAVSAPDTLGYVVFRGADGTNFVNGAQISAEVDNTVSSNNVPARLAFHTAVSGTMTERMRITSGGNVFINSTSNPAVGTEMFGVAAQGSGQTIAAGFANYVNTAPTVFVINGSNTTNTYLMRFASGSGGNTRGEIYYNGSQLVYATSSDYRLKENVIDFDGGIEIVKQLRPVRYNWIENGNEDIGFIAHEVQAVFPNAVGGEKDAVDDDGKILPQTYDPSKLVPLLTAALQEAVAKIESLEARLTAAGI